MAEQRTKRNVRTGFKKAARINYKRFYAMKFTIDEQVNRLELKTLQEVCAFYGVSLLTLQRIDSSVDFAAYKSMLNHSTTPAKDEEKAPADVPTTTKAAIKRKPVVNSTDEGLDKITVVLEKAENVLMSAYDVKKKVVGYANADPIPAPRRGFLGLGRKKA